MLPKVCQWVQGWGELEPHSFLWLHSAGGSPVLGIVFHPFYQWRKRSKHWELQSSKGCLILGCPWCILWVQFSLVMWVYKQMFSPSVVLVLGQSCGPMEHACNITAITGGSSWRRLSVESCPIWRCSLLLIPAICCERSSRHLEFQLSRE